MTGSGNNMSILQPHISADASREKKGSAIGLFSHIFSRVSAFVSTVVNIGVLYKYIRQSDLVRVLWVLSYIEKTQGGHEAYKRKLPFDKNANPLPWYTYPGIEFLQQFDFSNCNIFEYGSGNSSQFWSNKAHTVISVESDPEWYKFGIQDLPYNRTLCLKSECNEYSGAIHQNEMKYEVIVIDGMYRYNCAVESISRLIDGGVIILDNCDWFPETARFLRDSDFTQVDFIGAGPVNSYAWCTSVFFRGRISLHRISDSEPVSVLGGIAEISVMDKICS